MHTLPWTTTLADAERCCIKLLTAVGQYLHSYPCLWCVTTCLWLLIWYMYIWCALHAVFLPSFLSQRKMKMQAMFMEDDVVETSDVDDVRYNMRRALRANQVRVLQQCPSGKKCVPVKDRSPAANMSWQLDFFYKVSLSALYFRSEGEYHSPSQAPSFRFRFWFQ